MGGQTPAKQPRRGAIADKGGGSQGLASGGAERGEKGRNRRKRRGILQRHTRGIRELGEVSGVSPDGFLGRRFGRVGDVSGSSPYPQGEKGLPGHCPRGGGVEGSGGDSKSPFHILHHLPRRPPWFLGRSRHGDRHPRGQAASAACGHEGGGTLRDLPGPD